MAQERTTPNDAACCSPGDTCSVRAPLHERPLLGFVDAVKVMALFKVLANDSFREIMASDAYQQIMANDSYRLLLSNDVFVKVMANDAFHDIMANDAYHVLLASDAFRAVSQNASLSDAFLTEANRVQ